MLYFYAYCNMHDLNMESFHISSKESMEGFSYQMLKIDSLQHFFKFHFSGGINTR